MSNGKHTKKHIRILVKAFPQESTKHEETVCCAGVDVEAQQLLRLFPIRFRRLPTEHQFGRFDLVEMTVTKASDSRPESYRVDEASIKLLEEGSQLSPRSKVQLWKPFIAPSIKALEEDNRNTERSLGIIKPDPDSLKFKYKLAEQSDASEKEVNEAVYQVSLLEDELKKLERPKYSFYYEYTCAGHPHRHQIHDWEVQTTFINYRKRYGSEAEALKMMTQAYGENIPKHNLHFIMGTMKMHPRTFIVIGLLRTQYPPEELDKQKELL